MVAIVAYLIAPLMPRALPIPTMVIALVVGIALNPVAVGPAVESGIGFCIKTLLRWAVALLGVRIARADIVALGLTTAILVVGSMAVTIAAGFMFARS